MTCRKSWGSAQPGYPQTPASTWGTSTEPEHALRGEGQGTQGHQLRSPPARCQGRPEAPASQGSEDGALLPVSPWLLHQRLEDQLEFALLRAEMGQR